MKWTTYVWVLNGFTPKWMASGDFAMSRRGESEEERKKKKCCASETEAEKRRRQKQHKSQNEIYWVNMECDVRLSYTIFEHFSAPRASPFTMFTKSLSLFPSQFFLSLNISAVSPLCKIQQLWSRWSENRLSAYATERDDEFINRWHCLATVLIEEGSWSLWIQWFKSIDILSGYSEEKLNEFRVIDTSKQMG